jgi:hypothetical protein
LPGYPTEGGYIWEIKKLPLEILTGMGFEYFGYPGVYRRKRKIPQIFKLAWDLNISVSRRMQIITVWVKKDTGRGNWKFSGSLFSGKVGNSGKFSKSLESRVTSGSP